MRHLRKKGWQRQGKVCREGLGGCALTVAGIKKLVRLLKEGGVYTMESAFKASFPVKSRCK